jgi:hypothetical protein
VNYLVDIGLLTTKVDSLIGMLSKTKLMLIVLHCMVFFKQMEKLLVSISLEIVHVTMLIGTTGEMFLIGHLIFQISNKEY